MCTAISPFGGEEEGEGGARVIYVNRAGGRELMAGGFDADRPDDGQTQQETDTCCADATSTTTRDHFPFSQHLRKSVSEVPTRDDFSGAFKRIRRATI